MHTGFAKRQMHTGTGSALVDRKLKIVESSSSSSVEGSVLTHSVGQARKGGVAHDSYIIPVQTGGIFYLPWHRHQLEGTDVFSEAIHVLRNTVGVGGCYLSLKKRYEDVRINVISVTRGWVGVNFPEKNVT